MKKIKTLKKNYEFKNVLSKGKFYIGKFIIMYVKSNNKNENFIGIAINTKIGNAVKRNRIKRLIRENYRIRKTNLKKGKDIVFLVNKKIDTDNITYKDVENDMIKLLKKADMV